MRSITGKLTRRSAPMSQPLESAVSPADCKHFRWMFEVCLDDGRRLQAYKHEMTRRYLHLTDTGEAFRYCGNSFYAPVSLDAGISFALGIT
jgi:hypothetical protein